MLSYELNTFPSKSLVLLLLIHCLLLLPSFVGVLCLALVLLGYKMPSHTFPSKSLVLLLLIHCLLLLPLFCWGFVLGPCFVVQY